MKAQRKALIAGLVAVEIASAAAAWRDLNRRADNQVRGKKKIWRTFITLNPGNSLPYWAFGRR